MHAIKTAARREAWKGYDGNSKNYNPFARGGGRRRPGDEENQSLSVVRTAESVPSQAEEDRRSQYRENHPSHAQRAGTAPEAGINRTDQLRPSFEMPENENYEKPVEGVNNVHSPHVNGHEDGSESSGTKVDSRDINTVDSGRQNGQTTEKPSLRNRMFHKKHNQENDVSDKEEDGKKKPQWRQRSKIGPWGEFKHVIFGSWINILLIVVPVSFALNYAHVNGIVIFCVSFVAIIPLAAMLSFATEELAEYVGETLGGLLNATFGNATELIVSIIALQQKKVLIVQTSLIGSMLSNLLLVLGMCFFFGGINRVKQHFNITVAQTAASLLALSIGSLIIPTAFQRFGVSNDADQANSSVAPVSRGTSIILLLVYISYLIFQLKTHTDMYNEPSKKGEKRATGKKEKGDTIRGLARMGASSAASAGGQVNQKVLHKKKEDEDEDEKSGPTLSLMGALITLTAATVLIAFCSEFLVTGIDAVSKHISQEFIGLILLPIVGNAAEHATAVTVAIKDKMDLAIGVAVGSSMQIALLVLPLMVVIGWCGLGQPEEMTLDFDGFQVAVLFIAVLLVNYLIQDGESHWLEGVLLQATYIIIALTAYFYPVKPGAEVAG